MAGGVKVGRAAARMEGGAAGSAARRSAEAVQAEEVGGLLEDVVAQGAAGGRMYALSGAVGSLGWGAAEDEAAAQTAVAGSGRLAGEDLAAGGLWRAGGSVPAVVAGSKFVVVVAVVVLCSGSDHAIGRSLAGGLARSGG